jgi:hypothetical protein
LQRYALCLLLAALLCWPSPLGLWHSLTQPEPLSEEALPCSPRQWLVKERWSPCGVCLQTLSAIPLISLFSLLPTSHCLDYCSDLQHFAL